MVGHWRKHYWGPVGLEFVNFAYSWGKPPRDGRLRDPKGGGGLAERIPPSRPQDHLVSAEHPPVGEFREFLTNRLRP